MVEDLRGIDEEKNKTYVKEKKKNIAVCQGILRGDGDESTTASSNDENFVTHTVNC